MLIFAIWACVWIAFNLPDGPLWKIVTGVVGIALIIILVVLGLHGTALGYPSAGFRGIN